MSQTFKFWTHGVDVIPEQTKEYTKTNNGLYMLRAGWGAHIYQEFGGFNWFHFAIPSATELNGKPVYYLHDPDPKKPPIPNAWLLLKISKGAEIVQVDFREATGKGSNSPIILKMDKLTITDQDTTVNFYIPGKRCDGPLAMCVKVNFKQEGKNGFVQFAGAGVALMTL